MELRFRPSGELLKFLGERFDNTSTLTDNNGIKINQVFVGNIPANLNLEVKLYALAPMLLWVSDWNFLGARYSAYIAPAFSNANIAASLSVAQGQVVNPQTRDQPSPAQ